MGPKLFGEVILCILTHSVRCEDNKVEFRISICFVVGETVQRSLAFLTDHGDGLSQVREVVLTDSPCCW